MGEIFSFESVESEEQFRLIFKRRVISCFVKQVEVSGTFFRFADEWFIVVQPAVEQRIVNVVHVAFQFCYSVSEQRILMPVALNAFIETDLVENFLWN